MAFFPPGPASFLLHLSLPATALRQTVGSRAGSSRGHWEVF